MSARPAQAFRLSGFTPRRTAWLLVVLTLLASGPVAAADPAVAGAWLAQEIRGTVRVRAAGQPPTSWQPLQAEMPIAEESEIATGSDGSAILANGVDRI